MNILRERRCCDAAQQLDTKLFAHIHSDARLVGTTLEGNHFFNTAGYVDKVLKYLLDDQNKTGISEQTKKEILKSLTKTESLFQQLIHNEHVIEKYIKDHNKSSDYVEYVNVEKDLHNISNNMVDQLNQSATNELLIPGGWSGSPSGHAMAYKFRKEPDGKMTFLVYNTGAGIGNHLTKTSSKDKYIPIDAYEIPKDVKTEDLAHFIEGLIKPQILPRLSRVHPYKYVGDWNKDTKFNADRVYENIRKVTYLGAKRINASDFFKHYTQGQLSGTCSMRVLMPILRESMNSMAFRQMLYQFRLQSILDFYRNCETNRTLNNPEVQRQLRSALEKFAETTHKYSLRTKNPVITTAQAEESLSMVKQISSTLDMYRKMAGDRQEAPLAGLGTGKRAGGGPVIEKFLSIRPASSFRFNGGKSLVVDTDVKKEKDEQRQKQLPELKTFESKPLEYLRACRQVIESNAKQFYTEGVLDNIEKMMLTIPVMSPEADNFWRNLSKSDAKEALNILQSIIRIYGKHCHMKGGYALPQRWITAASGMFIAGRIANIQFGNDPKFSHLAGFIENAVQNKAFIGDPYSVSRDPRFDKRVQELKEHWGTIKKLQVGKSGGLAQYHHYDLELVEKHQLEKELNTIDPNEDVLAANDSMDKARVQLYRLAKGQIKSEEKKVHEALENLDFCTQFEEFTKECGLFEVGGFDYFNSIDSDAAVDPAKRLSKLHYEREDDSYVTQHRKSNFKYKTGVKVGSSYTSSLRDLCDFQDPIILDELFEKKYNYRTYYDGKEHEVEETGDFNFESNRALLHFNRLAKGLDKEKYPDYPSKDLPFTRINQLTRSTTTLDLFLSHLEYLNEKDKQEFCLFNLLTPSIFLGQAAKVSKHADQWIDLIEKGLKFHTRGRKMESGAFFSLTLSFYLLKYLGSQAPRFKSQIQRLQKLDKFIQDNIELHRKVIEDKHATKEDKETAASVIKDLEVLSFLRKSQTLLQQEKWDINDAKAMLRGIFYQNRAAAKRGQVLNLFMQNELDSVTQQLQPMLTWYLNHMSATDLDKMVREVVKEFLIPEVIPDENYKIQGKPPILTLKSWGDFSVDLTLGSVKTDKYIMRSVPTEFYTRDFLEFFGQREFHARVLNSGTARLCEFNCDGKEYRLILDDKGKLHIQMKIGAEKKWFELQNKKDIRGESESAGYELYTRFPGLYLEQGRYIWGEVGAASNQFFLTDKQGNITAEMKRESGKEISIEEVGPDGIKTGFQLQALPSDPKAGSLFSILTQVEDPNFIEVWQFGGAFAALKKVKINLPRYGLEFELTAEGGVNRLKSNNYPGWYLLPENLNSVQNFNNILYLVNENTGERMGLVPKQTFQPVSESEKDGEYYYLSLDTSNSIPAKALEKLEQGDWHWRHSGSQTMASFRLDANNQLQGTSQEEWLHIAYLHLAKHDALKAMQALNQCQKLGGLKGTPEEIEWVKRILSEIPDPYSKNDKLAEKAKTNEPESLAVRLRVAAMLADYKNVTLDTPKFDLSPPETLSKRESYNERYQDLKKKELIDFYTSEFENLAQSTYVDYYKVKGNIADNLALSPSLELSLLRQVFKKIPRTKAYGFVQGRWRELELVELRSEQNTLIKKKAQQSGTLSPRDEKRLQFVNEVLSRGNPYAVGSSVLRESTFKLEPNLVLFEDNELSLLQPDHVNTYKVERTYSPAELHPNMHLNHFLFSFKSLYDLARAPEDKSNAEQKQILKHFIDNWLSIWAGTTAPGNDKMSSLVIMLKYVIENPGNWPEYKNNTVIETQRTLEHITKLAQELASKKSFSVTAIRSTSGPDIQRVAKIESYEARTERQESGLRLEQGGTLPKKEPDIKKVFEEAKTLPMQQYLEKAPEFILANEAGIREVSDHYRSIVEATPKILDEMPEIFKKGQFEGRFLKDEVDHFTSDYLAGVKLNGLITEKREITKDCFKDGTVRRELSNKLNSSITLLDKKTRSEEIELLGLANKILSQEGSAMEVLGGLTGLSGVALAKYQRELSARLKVAAGRPVLQMADLITLYLQGNLEQFKNRTKLEEKECLQLYKNIHQYLLDKTAVNHEKRVLTKLEKLGMKDESDPDYEASINELGEELFTKRSFEPKLYPEMLVFEYLDNKYIRDPQLKMILDLLKKEGDGYTNKVIQMIMGGGKSKVIMPLLALKKADGTNLSMIIVPSALYETNVADLQAVSQRLFGQEAYEFKFTREKALDSDDLKERYKKMWQVIRNRGYMIATPESIQSLELRYLELLDSPPGIDMTKEAKEEWSLQVHYLERMLKLIKHRGDSLIDEVDSNLDPKRELNFTIGGEGEVPDTYIGMIVALYNLLPSVVVDTPQGSVPLEDILQGRREITDPKFWNEASELLARQLVNHPKSPLISIVRKLTPENKQLLIRYLLDKEEKLPAFIQLTDKDTQNRIALMKAEMQILPMTLQKKKDENYGFPKDPKAGVPMDIAIPYIANNIPNHRSQFGSYIETMNFTLQLHRRNEKIDAAVLKAFIKDFNVRASFDTALSLGRIPFTETDAYREFNRVTGWDLNLYDPDNEAQIEHLRDELSKASEKNKEIVDYCLKRYVLKKIKQHRFILRSDAVNHVSQYRSTQGMTGTPWIYRAFNQKLNFDPKETLGVDGQTMHHLLRKGTPVRKCQDASHLGIIQSLFNEPSKIDTLRAFIDIGALFHGVANEEIARLIAAEIRQQKGNQMTHILYFNADNILCALPIKDNAKPIVIGSSDPEVINAKTGSTPAQRFTYFDQHHTTGTDILQMPNALAYATIDSHTLARDFWQGVMRMRGLNSTQTIEVLLPPSVTETEDFNKVWNINDVTGFVLNNQFNKLAELHYQGAVQNMRDIIRQHFLNMIYFQKSPEDKVELYKKFNEFFLTCGVLDPFEQFGDIEKPELTSKAFEGLITHYLDTWKRILGGSPKPMTPSADQELNIRKSLKDVADRAIACCKETVKARGQYTAGATVEVQKEKEKEKEKEKMKELLQITSLSEAHLKAIHYKPWGISHMSRLKHAMNSSVQVTTLNKMLESTDPKANLPFKFDENILVSENFMNSHETQKEKLDAFVKPVNFYLLTQDESGKLSAMIITQEEAVEFSNAIQTGAGYEDRRQSQYWVVSPHDTIFASTTAELPSNPEFYRVKEQICYFNADLDALSDTSARYQWMQENNKAKIDYLETRILPQHPGKQKAIKPLLKSFSQAYLLNGALHALQSFNLGALKTALDNIHGVKNEKERSNIINARTSEGYTLLGYAVKNADSAAFNTLMQFAEINPLALDSEGRFPLLIAVEKKHKTLQGLMSDDRFLPPTTDTHAWNLLFGAAFRTDSLDLITKWLQKIASFSKELQKEFKTMLLLQAIANDKTDYARKLLSDPDIDLKQRDEAGNTALEAAIQTQNVPLISIIFDKPATYPYKDDDAWDLLLHKLVNLKDEKTFSELMMRIMISVKSESEGKQAFIQNTLLKIIKESQKTRNLQALKQLCNYFAKMCRAKDPLTSEILESFKELFQRSLLDGDFEGMNVLLTTIRSLHPDQISVVLEPGAVVKDRVKKWISVTIPSLKDPDYVQQGKLKIYQQFSKDPQFALDTSGLDFKAWRELLQQAIEFSNPEFVKQILQQIKLMPEEQSRVRILGLLQKSAMALEGPITWSTSTVLENPRPEIVAKQREIVALLCTAPEVFPQNTNTTGWGDTLRNACSLDAAQSDILMPVFLKFAQISDQKLKAEVLGYNVSSGVSRSPLILSAIESQNYSIFALLLKLGADPKLQNQTSGDSVLHLLLRDYKNLERMQEWLPILQNPAINPNLVNKLGETAFMQFLFMVEDINNLPNMSRETKRQIINRWLDCVTTLLKREDLDITLKNKQGMTLPDIVADLQIGAGLKSRIAQIVKERMDVESGPSGKAKKFV